MLWTTRVALTTIDQSQKIMYGNYPPVAAPDEPSPAKSCRPSTTSRASLGKSRHPWSPSAPAGKDNPPHLFRVGAPLACALHLACAFHFHVRAPLACALYRKRRWPAPCIWPAPSIFMYGRRWPAPSMERPPRRVADTYNEAWRNGQTLDRGLSVRYATITSNVYIIHIRAGLRKSRVDRARRSGTWRGQVRRELSYVISIDTIERTRQDIAGAAG